MAKITITGGPGVYWSTIKQNLNSMFTELYSFLYPTSYINTQTSNYTIALPDAGFGVLVGMDKETAIVLTIPTNTQVAFPIGSEILVSQAGVGILTIIPYDETVIINSISVPPYTAIGRHATVALKKIDTNTWLLAGALV